ncbi:MAG: ethanolamine ammonia-lyase subunit EutC [Polaromonas sp.]|uniref:ethanolamine ammonia-lyase subunit EutC n=1 Tax=Polaromonas sp. TaxID=1869339 RepID=UPI0024885F07|nr:ethanolamine ammonia-lyase subunit EutC [Polaromonas sp.]MDI1238753.1 ethanolamine ammonia-lyase subunit EutC [Polaromonas sp.]
MIDTPPSAAARDTAVLVNEMWAALRPLTAARIGLPRTGASLATPALLDFRLAHARARDAVGAALDSDALKAALAALDLPALVCRSATNDRRTYLMRPDQGRQLDQASLALLQASASRGGLAIVLADGLSAQATQSHTLPLLQALLPLLVAQGWAVAPVVLLHNGRVAAGDKVARALQAEAVLVLIGERPGLSSPDSLGAYITWAPGPGTSDADRNCVSNIRPQGLAPEAAAAKIAWLLDQMRKQQRSGVALKDLTGQRLQGD